MLIILLVMGFFLQGKPIQVQGVYTPVYSETLKVEPVNLPTVASVIPYRPGLLEVQPVDNPNLVN